MNIDEYRWIVVQHSSKQFQLVIYAMFVAPEKGEMIREGGGMRFQISR